MTPSTTLALVSALCACEGLDLGTNMIETPTPNHCQHVADYYYVRDAITWDNLMRDALGVKRLPMDKLLTMYGDAA